MNRSLSTFRSFALPSSLLLLASVLSMTQGCSTSPDPTPATGGTAANTGGAASSTGGSATGGTATGGSATGGAATGGTATGGTATGGTATGGTATGGAAGAAGTTNTGGAGAAATGGSGNGGAASGGSASGGAAGGGTAGKGGTGGAGTAGGGAAGASGSGTGGGGGAGGTTAGKTAVAMLAPTTGNQITGTATFTQTGQSITLVIQVSNCPTGSHASHIHVNKNCGDNGNLAGAHWVPQGEVIPDIVCTANGMGTATVTPPAGTWTIGGAADITAHALMIHVGSSADPAGRIACGLINAQ